MDFYINSWNNGKGAWVNDVEFGEWFKFSFKKVYGISKQFDYSLIIQVGKKEYGKEWSKDYKLRS